MPVRVIKEIYKDREGLLHALVTYFMRTIFHSVRQAGKEWQRSEGEGEGNGANLSASGV